MNILQGANRYRTIQEIAELDTVFSGTPVTRLAYAENPGNDSTWRPSPAIRRHTLPAGALVTIVASAQTAAVDAYFELANQASGGGTGGTAKKETFIATLGQKQFNTVGTLPDFDNMVVNRNGLLQQDSYAPIRNADKQFETSEPCGDGDIITVTTNQ